MAKVPTTSSKLTRGDKAHKKFMDKLDAFKETLTHGFDSFTLINKQTLESSKEYYEKVSKSQEAERCALYDIIKSSEDETKCEKAYARLTELDNIKEKTIENQNKFIQDEGDKSYKNIAGGIIIFVLASGLMSSKQVRQIPRKFMSIKRNEIDSNYEIN